MHRFTVLFLLTLTLQLHAQTNCERYSDDHIPTDLNDAINFLNCIWSDTSKIDFKNKPEIDAVAELHFGTGRSIRNNWGLWSQKSTLYRFFKSKGIFHPDDMSAIILTSFHRTLNGKDIQLDQQIIEYQEYWNSVKMEIENQKEIDREEYKKFKVGDSVFMNFSIDETKNVTTSDTTARLHTVGKQTELPTEHCPIEGIVKKKKGSKGNGFYLLIQVTDFCDYRYKLIYDADDGHLKVGDLILYNMSVNNISKK
jgi:hypothetical protein